MEHWFTGNFSPGVYAYGAMGIAIAGLLFAWRFQGVFNWRRSLRNEIKAIEAELETAGETRRQAFQIVLAYCRRARQSNFPALADLTEVASYLHSIALCFHPGAEKPELRITLGRFLNCAREVIQRLDLILGRSGFKRLKRVRIRHIRKSYKWCDRATNHRLVRRLSPYRKTLARIFQFRLLVLPDPFLWIAHLFNRLTLLALTRCLLVDVYLFLGKLAIDAYDQENTAGPYCFQEDALKYTLEDIDDLPSPEPDIADPRIREIRKRLVGFASMVTSTPSFEDWKEAVRQAAEATSRKYFPESECPLEEAALGPILTRGQAWLRSICEIEKTPAVKRCYKIRIETLFTIKTFTDGMLPGQVQAVIKNARHTYRWIKWPLRAYRMFKKSSSLGMAMAVGWMVAKKSLVNYTCRYTFDRACKELEMIYSQSRATARTPD